MKQSSSRRFKLTIDGVEYLVELTERPGSSIEVTVNGDTFQVAIEAAGDQPQAAESGAGADQPPAAIEPVRPSAAASGRAADEVRAPMPGDILDIQVKPGDRIAVGQTLCALEAMKMKSAIGAPRDGVIATVEVVEGQPVKYGDMLFTLT